MARLRDGFIEAGGRRLEARWIGPPPDTAPTLVFLHEGLGCVDMWRGFPAGLARRTGCGALIYSRAGYGRSDPVDLPRPLDYHTPEALEVLPGVLDAAGVRRAVLVGHSDGATIALMYAGWGAAGRKLLAVVAMAPHVFWEEACLPGIRAAGEAFARGELRRRLAHYHGDNVEGAFHGWHDVWTDPGFRTWNVEACLDAITVPVLALQGRADEYGTLAHLESIAARAPAPVERAVIEGCGHSPHLERPEETEDRIARFLAVHADLTDVGPKPP